MLHYERGMGRYDMAVYPGSWHSVDFNNGFLNHEIWVQYNAYTNTFE